MSWIFDFACCWCIDCYKSHWPARSTAFPWTFGVLLRPSLSWPLIRCFSRHGGMRVDEVELFSRCPHLDLAILKDVTLWQGERECFWFTFNSDKTESWKWWQDFSLEICNTFAILQSVLSVFDTYFLNVTSLYHFEICLCPCDGLNWWDRIDVPRATPTTRCFWKWWKFVAPSRDLARILPPKSSTTVPNIPLLT